MACCCAVDCQSCCGSSCEPGSALYGKTCGQVYARVTATIGSFTARVQLRRFNIPIDEFDVTVPSVSFGPISTTVSSDVPCGLHWKVPTGQSITSSGSSPGRGEVSYSMGAQLLLPYVTPYCNMQAKCSASMLFYPSVGARFTSGINADYTNGSGPVQVMAPQTVIESLSDVSCISDLIGRAFSVPLFSSVDYSCAQAIGLTDGREGICVRPETTPTISFTVNDVLPLSIP